MIGSLNVIELFAKISIVGCYILALSFTVWMIVDAAKQDKFWWLVFTISLPFVGALIYFFAEKEHLYRHVNTKGDAVK